MKKIVLIALLFFGLGSSRSLFAQSEDSYVHCLLLDKTLSMTGHGGENIWDDVVNYCCDWVDGLQQNSKLLFFTYAKDLQGPQVFDIKSNDDKDAIKKAIQSVVVDGRQTWIASNLEKVVQYAYDTYPSNKKTIYLITDGKEEQPGVDLNGILDKYVDRRGDYDYLYYVDLNGLADDKTKEAFKGHEGTDMGTGRPVFYTLKPEYLQLNYTLDDNALIEQHFSAVGTDPIPELSFKLKVDSTVFKPGSAQANVRLSPNALAVKDLKKNGNDYQFTFGIEFFNGQPSECNIYVSLEGEEQGNDRLAFSPAKFTISVTKKENKVVVKKGWH